MTAVNVPDFTMTVQSFDVTVSGFQVEVLDEEPEPAPLRGVRGQASNCSTATKCSALLDCLQAAGANFYLYPAFGASSHKAYYASKIVPQRYSDRDPLQYLIEQAHARDIQVYALVAAATIGWPQHPEWNAQANHAEIHTDWLDFTLPETRAFIAGVADEIADYDVDGILLDYIRWPIDDVLPAGPITETVRQTSQACGNVTLAASVLADPAYAPHQGQDWVHWLTEDYLDLVNPMAYYDNDILHLLLQAWHDTGFFPNHIIPRLSVAQFDPFQIKLVAEVLQQIQICYSAGATGMTLWDDRYVCRNSELIEALGGGGW